MPVLRRLEHAHERLVDKPCVCEHCAHLHRDRRRLPSMTQFTTFLEVVAAGSFVAAARKLDVEASTVRRVVDQLELLVGQQLLSRQPSAGVRLTAAGRIFYPTAAWIVHLAIELISIRETTT